MFWSAFMVFLNLSGLEWAQEDSLQTLDEFYIQLALNFSVWVKLNDIYLISDLESWPPLSPIWLKECTSKQSGICFLSAFASASCFLGQSADRAHGGQMKISARVVRLWRSFEGTKQNKLDVIIPQKRTVSLQKPPNQDIMQRSSPHYSLRVTNPKKCVLTDMCSIFEIFLNRSTVIFIIKLRNSRMTDDWC